MNADSCARPGRRRRISRRSGDGAQNGPPDDSRGPALARTGGHRRPDDPAHRGRPFTDKQIDSVMTFADQAVIAIENVRLFDEVHARTRELTEALEQQTATSEILRVISMSPSNVQPVFETIVRNAFHFVAACCNVFRSMASFCTLSPPTMSARITWSCSRKSTRCAPTLPRCRDGSCSADRWSGWRNALADPDYDHRSPWPWAGGECLGCRCCAKVNPSASSWSAGPRPGRFRSARKTC
jgi:hypothetical protein